MKANSDWLFLTNLGTVLVSIAGDPARGISEPACFGKVEEPGVRGDRRWFVA
jgi:hypothetical protein